MGEHFSSSSRDLVGSFLRTLQNIIHILIMKFFAIIAFVGYTQAFLVRREAAPEADADADAGYGYGAVSPAAVSAPVCNSVPEKVCKDRTIETPRKVCHTEHDEIVDTTITEHCEEVITTKCEQTSTQSRHSSAIVGQGRTRSCCCYPRNRCCWSCCCSCCCCCCCSCCCWRSCCCLWWFCCPPCCRICWHRSRTRWICWILIFLYPHFYVSTLSHFSNRFSLIL